MSRLPAVPIASVSLILVLACGSCTGCSRSPGLRCAKDGHYVCIPDCSALDLVGPFTVEAWVKLEPAVSTQPFGFIVSKNINGTGYALVVAGSRLQFEANRVGGRYGSARASSDLLVGEWVHVAGVWEKGEARLYLDGELEAEEEVPDAPVANDCHLCIGGSPFGADTSWRGLIDEVRIWSVARSQAELAQDMKRRLSGAEPGLAAYWPLDEAEGQAVQDITGNCPPGHLGDRETPDEKDPEWAEGVSAGA